MIKLFKMFVMYMANIPASVIVYFPLPSVIIMANELSFQPVLIQLSVYPCQWTLKESIQ
jgi:hypothetical protein